MIKKTNWLRHTAYLAGLACFFALLPGTACKSDKNNAEGENMGRVTYLEDKNNVEIMVLDQGAFTRQLVSNGKLNALLKSELRFRVSETIEQINVSNGSRVKSGDVLASLNSFELQQRYQQAKTNLEKSKIDRQEALINQGFSTDATEAPADILELVNIRSGYAQALNAFNTAAQNLSDCNLVAPFAGVVANIKQKAYERTGGDAFCTLIDDLVFEVAFNLLESELPEVRLKQSIKIIPFSLPGLLVEGFISEINPVVDRNGMIAIKATVSNKGELLEGMNVKVLIENDIPGQFVVPKSAVVLRDNFEVLFKVVNGVAYWNYIETLHENTTSYAVRPHPEKSSASLSPGDTIIISGNLHLAHESEVVINN
jgi:membrane fusion protein, multidrug efflux system